MSPRLVTARSKNGRSTQSRSARRRKKAPRARAGNDAARRGVRDSDPRDPSGHGGRAPTREVIDALGERLDGRLTEADRERWRRARSAGATGRSSCG